MRAELEILGLDASRHVVETYARFLDELGATRSKDLLSRRSKAELLVAGVKVATQTPPIRSGRRVIFLTLDDSAPARSTRRSSRTPRAPTPPPSSTPGCWSCAASCGAPAGAGSRCAPPAAGSCPSCSRSGGRGDGRRARGDGGGARGLRRGGVENAVAGAAESRSTRPVWPRPATPPAAVRPAAWASAGCWCTPAGSECRPTPTSSRPARRHQGGPSPASCWHRSPREVPDWHRPPGMSTPAAH